MHAYLKKENANGCQVNMFDNVILHYKNPRF